MSFFDCFKGILKNTLAQKRLNSTFLQLFHRLLHAIKRAVKYSILRKIGLALHIMKTKKASVNLSVDSLKNENILMFFSKNILIRGYFLVIHLRGFCHSKMFVVSRVVFSEADGFFEFPQSFLQVQ